MDDVGAFCRKKRQPEAAPQPPVAGKSAGVDEHELYVFLSSSIASHRLKMNSSRTSEVLLGLCDRNAGFQLKDLKKVYPPTKRNRCLSVKPRSVLRAFLPFLEAMSRPRTGGGPTAAGSGAPQIFRMDFEEPRSTQHRRQPWESIL